jgi:RNA polymerase sigma-70 factor (ECF subfamily)
MTDDMVLIARWRADGDRAALGMLIERHQPRVRLYLRQLTRDAQLADDLAQDTFMRAIDRLPTFDGRGPFVAWLLALARRECLQGWRRTRRRARIAGMPVVDVHAADAGDDAHLHGVFDGGERSANDSAEAQHDIDRLLHGLSEDERTAVLLNHGYGLSHGDVAAITGTPLGTVKSHIVRAMRKLRERARVPGLRSPASPDTPDDSMKVRP